ncbi:hypothetical protein, partial [Segatella buccae]|uniref:hypothetical protein n=1 Tax=Segatella buccae TaxID=28126 RepID=UPI0019552C6B
KLKGPQLQRNCGPFASPVGPFQSFFRRLIFVNEIQTADYQRLEEVAKFAHLRRAGCPPRISQYQRPKTDK